MRSRHVCRYSDAYGSKGEGIIINVFIHSLGMPAFLPFNRVMLFFLLIITLCSVVVSSVCWEGLLVYLSSEHVVVEHIWRSGRYLKNGNVLAHRWIFSTTHQSAESLEQLKLFYQHNPQSTPEDAVAHTVSHTVQTCLLLRQPWEIQINYLNYKELSNLPKKIVCD